MRGREVFLVSEIGEVRIGSVDEILNGSAPAGWKHFLDTSISSVITDVVSEISFDPNLGNSMSITIEIR